MKAKPADEDRTTLSPRETSALHGHADAETTLLAAYRSGRMPHAWLIGGDHGIGKATLAYRMARFALAHPDQNADDVQRATSLAIDRDSNTARQVAAGSHGGLLTIERALNDKGVLRTVIRAEEARETLPFFGSTAAAAGSWRVCIVDTVDELNSHAANALLKILEEPPNRSLFLLVSHSLARVLPTILSRCRRLPLRPLSVADVTLAIADATGRATTDTDVIEAADAADGSVGRAMMLLDPGLRALRQRTTQLLDNLPKLDPRALHGLGEALGTSDRMLLGIVAETIERWIAVQLNAPDAALQMPRLVRLAEVWDKIIHAVRDAETYNLERKPLMFSVFGQLADATRA